MARLSVGWKGGIFESLQFVFNRRKVRRYFFLFTCELANAKRPARLRQAVVNSDGVQFQFLVTLCRINEDELPLGYSKKCLWIINRTRFFTTSWLTLALQVGMSVTGIGRSGCACRISEPSPRTKNS